MARYMLQQLKSEMLDVRVQYLNCWRHHSRWAALYQLLDGVGQTLDVHRQSTPHDELLSRIESADDQPYVVILDEVDQLDEDGILYELYRMPHIHFVLIANREVDLFADMDDRLVSRLRSGRRIQFDRYGIEEIVSILKKRVEKGHRPGTADRSHLEHIADLAAGDARVAIQTLKEAARLGQKRGRDQFSTALISEAEPIARENLREKTLLNLSRHQRILYEILEDLSESQMGAIHEEYGQRVQSPKSRKTVQRYLKKMSDYDLVAVDGEKRGASIARSRR